MTCVTARCDGCGTEEVMDGGDGLPRVNAGFNAQAEINLPKFYGWLVVRSSFGNKHYCQACAPAVAALGE